MSPFARGAIEALTFDCYGTLVDWDGGIRAGLAELPSLAGADLERMVRERERAEYELLASAYRPYGQVLGESLRRAAREQGCVLVDEEVARFTAGMARWPPFPDAPAALARLGRRYRLAILSNVEPRTLEASVAALGARFDALVTAEDVRSYKPASAHFEEGLRRLDLPCDRVLHVAGSLYHDVRPALALGWRAAFVDRRGEGVPPDLRPDLVVRDLDELVAGLEA